MLRMKLTDRLRNAVLLGLPGLLVLSLVCGIARGHAATPPARKAEALAPVNTLHVNALLISDVHFDAFHDPGKLQKLIDAPLGEWNAILAEPASPDQVQAFQSLQKTCGPRGIDTPYALLQSSLRAMKANVPDAAFALVSGDLVAHDVQCRFKTLRPGSEPEEYRRFQHKTLQYVVGQLRLSLSGMPVYVALGNNDSGCGDNRMDNGDLLLDATRETIVGGLAMAKEKGAVAASFSARGDYSLTMQGPMRRTRLIVLDDVFQSQSHRGCGGEVDPTAGTAQIVWLANELAKARRAKEKVWVMGHIPAGIDAFSTFSKMKNICGGGTPPTMFLTSEKMADVMGEYADVVQLGIFGHTHMDEMRLFSKNDRATGKVAIKIVSSISPVYGNDPSFTVARVDPTSSHLLDYQVISASNRTGIDTIWKKEYSFGETFQLPSFTAATLQKLMAEFSADPDARTDSSRAYLTHYFPGDQSMLLKSLWPQYVCSLTDHTAKGFAACMCPADTSAK